MEFHLNFGKRIETVNVDQKNLLGVLTPNEVNVELTGAGEVRRALANPIGTPRVRDIVNNGEKIVIITSDITRPMPSKIVLPEVVSELVKGGVKQEDITIVLALGSHRKHTEEEKKYLVGEEMYAQVKCIDSDPQDFVYLGDTSRGTRVEIFTPVTQADRIICLGNIEYHYFAGYSGGAKAVMPGVSTRNAIQSNHSMMVEEMAFAGSIDENPVRQDIEEVANFVNISFIINVVLDEKKTIIKAVAGHYQKAHREGCRFLDSLYRINIPEKVDIVLVSSGGYPKDINIYQAQKALNNAKHAVKKDGIIIWVASCGEGFGEKVFERWMCDSSSSKDMIEKIKINFELGGHKAAAIAIVLENAKIFLVSDLAAETVKKIYLEPFSSAEQALHEAFSRLGDDAEVLIMPYGGSTLPIVASHT